MATAYRISLPQPRASGSVVLEPSKSLSNRALIIRSLCDQDFTIDRLSTSDDTATLVSMLGSDANELFAGHAGTSFRFMVARACLMDREIKLEASMQLRRRPIGPLVRALQQLGADISYVHKDGFPPLLIRPSKDFGRKVNEVTLSAGISSQYISALLMIAPSLPQGMVIQMEDEAVSRTYVDMTLSMMKYFGVEYEWKGNAIHVPPGKYMAKDFSAEGDWSSASYYYSMAALAPEAELEITGLAEQSLQGDAVVNKIYKTFGVETHFSPNAIRLTKQSEKISRSEFKYDFTLCPDLAQTVMVTAAALGVKSHFSGLKTLRIKETDRLAAMQTELARVKATLLLSEVKGNWHAYLSGKAKWKDRAKFHTYDDHRMAMAFAPLACIKPIVIRNPDVVSKSYPGFWKDLEGIGVVVEKVRG